MHKEIDLAIISTFSVAWFKNKSGSSFKELTLIIFKTITRSTISGKLISSFMYKTMYKFDDRLCNFDNFSTGAVGVSKRLAR